MKTKGAVAPGHARTKRAPTSAGRKHAQSRKSKPSFDIPAGAAEAASQDWVFRTDDNVPAPTLLTGPHTPSFSSAATGCISLPKPGPHAPPPRSTAVFMVAGFGMLLAGVAAIGIASITVVGAVGVPVMIARGMFRR